ncbi:MAG: class I SAM-dependent methyltransferase [Candidatus Omnitrophica bacterium]|nr:class I SAM-dependent methyltransferase [Candidatus Omnitrophota bacterium]
MIENPETPVMRQYFPACYLIVALAMGHWCVSAADVPQNPAPVHDASNQSKNYKFTADWVSSNVPVWEKVLAPYKGAPGVNYLEIGVWEGRSAIWMLENILTDPSSRMTALDIFPPESHARFLSNLEKSGVKDKVTVIKGYSQIELRKLPLDSFDIIYVDGSHMAGDVLADAVLSWPLLKNGGILIFDDYQWERPYPDDLLPKTGIDSFITAFRLQTIIVHQGYQMILKKNANSVEFTDTFRMGPYIYFWKKGKLSLANPRRPVPVTRQEKKYIKRLILSRPYGVSRIPYNEALKSPDAAYALFVRRLLKGELKVQEQPEAQKTTG